MVTFTIPFAFRGVPSDLRSTFVQSSQHDRERLLEFKQFLKENGLILLNT